MDNPRPFGLVGDFCIYSALAAAGILARIGWRLGGDPPPVDALPFAAWRRKQLWSAIGEFMTIPAFGAAWIGAAYRWHPPVELIIPGCLISGALGFGFWIDAIGRLINRKIGNG
jgi:hypothetical protein